MTYDDVVNVFGGEDREPSETMLRLSVSFPRFGPRELLEAFRLVASEWRSPGDVSPAAATPCRGVTQAAFLSCMASLMKMKHSRTYYSSDIILRNLYRVMFETSEWDVEILLQPDFVDGFCRFVDEVRDARFLPSRQLGRAWLSQSSLDMYEALAEFRDRLVEKAKAASGA